jgi:serine/threonine-protein kinase
MAHTPTTLAPLGPGERVGSYEIIGHLATGGMGEVYLAKKRGIGGFERSVVLKVMLQHLAFDERFARMFIDEARIVSSLSHPNIVQVFDLDRSENGALYLAMEHLVGQSVAACLKQSAKQRSHVPVEVAARIVCDAATGLAHAHAATDARGESIGLVHRDISPENLFVTFAGPTKILDFGVAKVKNRLVKTQHGEFKGKLGYMAPESIKGGKVDARSDLFSLGVVLFELLTTRRLFHAANPATSLHRVLTQDVPDVRTLRHEVDETLARICARMVVKQREQRIGSAEEVADRLERWLATKTGTSKHAGIWLEETFRDAHALSARIAEGLERTGQIDQQDILRARAAGGEDLDDTLVRELDASAGASGRLKRSAALAELDARTTPGADDMDTSWVLRARAGRWLIGLFLFAAVAAGAGTFVRRIVRDGRTPLPAVGIFVGGYEVKQTLLESSEGSVYLVKDKTSPRSLLLRVGRPVADPESLRSAFDAARSRLTGATSSLPKLEGVGIDGTRVFYAMEWREGRTLVELLDREVVTPKRARELVFGLTEALSHASEAGLIHGALRPFDLWIDTHGKLSLHGFRMGYLPPDDQPTPRLIAPEAKQAGRADAMADQYAAAVIVQDILRTSDQDAAVAAAPVLARATALRPTDRYRSNTEFSRALADKLQPRRSQRRSR